MPHKGWRKPKTEYVKSRVTRAMRIEKRIDDIKDCVLVNYAQDRRDLTGRICGDPMPEHRIFRERLLEKWKGETNTRESSEDS